MPLLLIATAGEAQRKMVVRYNDGTPDLKVDVSNIDSVFFVVERPATDKGFNLIYSSSHNVNLVSYNGGYSTSGSSINILTSDATIFENDLLANGLDYETFNTHYSPRYTISGYMSDLDQFYIENESAFLADPENVQPSFKPVLSSPTIKAKAGSIWYDHGGINPLRVGIFKWDMLSSEVTAFTSAGIPYLTRAVCLKSDDSVNYPDIYVILKSGRISVENKEVVLDMGVSSHRINEFWFSHDYPVSGPFQMGTDEIHTSVETPEMADQYGMGAPYQTWKPLVFENYFMNVFLNNFRQGTFNEWLKFENAPSVYGQPFTAANVELAMIFDKAGNGEYFAQLSAGTPTVMVVKNMNGTDATATDKTFTTLYARLKTANDVPSSYQKVATLNGMWTGRPFNSIGLQSMKIVLATTEYAKALLNYSAPDGIMGNGVLKAKVAVVPKNKSALGKSHVQDDYNGFMAEWTDYPVTISSTDASVYEDAVRYQSGIDNDGNPIYTYYPIKLKDYQFDVRFLRPISVTTVNSKVVNINSGSSRIQLSDFMGSYTDFRGGNFGGAPFWKTASQGGLDYEEYYSPLGKNKFVVGVEGLNIGDYLSQNRNVMTNLNQASPDVFVPLYRVSSNFSMHIDTWDAGSIVIDSFGTSLSGSFKVRIPLTIDYFWGTLYETVELTIQ